MRIEEYSKERRRGEQMKNGGETKISLLRTYSEWSSLPITSNVYMRLKVQIEIFRNYYTISTQETGTSSNDQNIDGFVSDCSLPAWNVLAQGKARGENLGQCTQGMVQPADDGDCAIFKVSCLRKAGEMEQKLTAYPRGALLIPRPPIALPLAGREMVRS